MKKRRPILLLELFIALFLLATCLLPLVSGLPLFFRKSLDQLKEIELNRLANLKYLELQTNLPTIIKWEHLERSMKEYPLAPVEITLNKMKHIKYDVTAKVWIWKEFEGKNETNYRLLGCNLYFTHRKQQHKFQYKLFVYKKKGAVGNA